MKLLIEKSILTPDEELKLNNISDRNKKIKYIKKWLKNYPNYLNLKTAIDLYAISLTDDGVDDSKNKFIVFMEHVPLDLDLGTVNLIKTLIDSKKLNPKASWLYKTGIYKDKENTLFYIKALTYASNPFLQKEANKQISIKDLYGVNGKLLSPKTIENKLKSISISTEDDLDNTKEKEVSNNKNITAQDIIKKELHDPTLSVSDFRAYLLNILKGNVNEKVLSQMVSDDETFKIVWKDLSKILTSKVTTALDEQPIEVVNDLLIQTLNSNIEK